MIHLKRMLGHLFPLMALSGLLLAGWGLIVTPDDIKSNAQGALWGARAEVSVASTDGITTNSWRD